MSYVYTYTYKLIWRKNNPVKLPNLPTDLSKEERNMLIQTVKQEEEKTEEIMSDGDNLQTMDVWDFAGQIVFYATHTLFHSRKAFYLLVFNLSLGLSDVVLNDDEKCSINHGKKTMEYYFRFWVNSVHSFVGNEDGTLPIIILVGTHYDKLEGDECSKKRQADKYFDNIRNLFKGKQALNHIYHKDFALDTRDHDSKTLLDLRDTLVNLGNEISLSRTVPIKWIQLEKCLIERREEKIVTFSTIVDINAKTEYPLENEEQIKQFLKNKHDQGLLFYFDEEPVSQFVVLDPQFLVDAFKSLITAERFVKNMPDIYHDWQALSTEGRLTNTLIDKLWTCAKTKGFMEHKDTILWFLQKHRIISQAMKFDETKQEAVGLGWYVVPSLLPDHAHAEEISSFQSDRVQTKIQYVLSFDNSAIVPTVYNRLVAAILGKWSILEFRGKKLLFENLSIVQMDSYHAGVIRLNDLHIHLSVMTLSRDRNIDRSITDGFRRFAEAVILYEFRKQQGVKEHKVLPFTRGYCCNHPSHNVYGGSKVKQFNRDLSIDCSTCPDLESHERIEISCATAEWFLGIDSFPNVPPGCPSDETFAEISKHIGKNREMLAAILGISEVKMDHIKDENRSCFRQNYKMLLEWRNMNDGDVSLNALIRELKRLPDVRVNWDGIRNLLDELNDRS